MKTAEARAAIAAAQEEAKGLMIRATAQAATIDKLRANNVPEWIKVDAIGRRVDGADTFIVIRAKAHPVDEETVARIFEALPAEPREIETVQGRKETPASSYTIHSSTYTKEERQGNRIVRRVTGGSYTIQWKHNGCIYWLDLGEEKQPEEEREGESPWDQARRIQQERKDRGEYLIEYLGGSTTAYLIPDATPEQRAKWTAHLLRQAAARRPRKY